MSEIDRYKTLLEAIEKERQHEEKYYAEIAKQKTDKDRIEAGVLLTSLFIKKKYYTIGEFVEIQLEITKNNDKPNKFKTGAGVIVRLLRCVPHVSCLRCMDLSLSSA